MLLMSRKKTVLLPKRRATKKCPSELNYRLSWIINHLPQKVKWMKTA